VEDLDEFEEERGEKEAEKVRRRSVVDDQVDIGLSLMVMRTTAKIVTLVGVTASMRRKYDCA